MKSFFKIFTVVLLVALVLVSCKPEQPSEEKNPYVKSSDPAFAKTAIDTVPYSSNEPEKITNWVTITEGEAVVSELYASVIDGIFNVAATEYTDQKATLSAVYEEVMTALSEGAVPEIATEGSISITLTSGTDSIVLSATTTAAGEAELSYKLPGGENTKICTVSDVINAYQESYTSSTDEGISRVEDALEDAFESIMMAVTEELVPTLESYILANDSIGIQVVANKFALKVSVGGLTAVATLDANLGVNVVVSERSNVNVTIANSNIEFVAAINAEFTPAKALTAKASDLIATANGPKFLFSIDGLKGTFGTSKDDEVDINVTVGLARVAASCNDLSASVVVKDLAATSGEKGYTFTATILAGVKEAKTGSTIGLKFNANSASLEDRVALLSGVKVYVGGKELVSPNEEYPAAAILLNGITLQ